MCVEHLSFSASRSIGWGELRGVGWGGRERWLFATQITHHQVDNNYIWKVSAAWCGMAQNKVLEPRWDSNWAANTTHTQWQPTTKKTFISSTKHTTQPRRTKKNGPSKHIHTHTLRTHNSHTLSNALVWVIEPGHLSTQRRVRFVTTSRSPPPGAPLPHPQTTTTHYSQFVYTYTPYTLFTWFIPIRDLAERE